MDPKSVGEETIPEDLREALAAAPAAEAAWKELTPIGRRDFLSWIREAKQAETRKKRIRIACEKLVAGKRRPCCFAVVPMDFYKALGVDAAAKAQWGKLSADEKRDLTDWIEAAEDKEARKGRVVEACALLTEGRRHPHE